MSAFAATYARTSGVFDSPDKKPILRTRAKFHFRAFISPDGYWPSPYSIEQAFGVLRWMAETGADKKKYGDRTTWVTQSVASLVSCKPTCGVIEIDAVRNIADLTKRFHYALLSIHNGPAVQRWRLDHNVTPDGEAVIHFPHYQYSTFGKCEAQNKIDIENFLGIAGGKINCQLNSCHARAIAVHGILLNLVPFAGYKFSLRYGYARDRGSWWVEPLAYQRKGEPFMDTFTRAKSRLEQLTTEPTP